MMEYRKVMTRSLSLLAIEYWERGEREESKKLFDGVYFTDALFVFVPGMGVDVYYNWTDPNQDPLRLVEYLNAKPEAFFPVAERFIEQCDAILITAKRKEADDFEKLVGMLTAMWPMAGVVKILGAWDRTELHPEIKNRCFDLRAKTDTVFYVADAALQSMAEKIVGASHVEDLDFFTFHEIVSHEFPSRETINERRRGFIFFQGILTITSSLDEFIYDHEIDIVVPSADIRDEILGQSACAGEYTGTVCRVFERSQFGKMKQGDVLVVSMTTPDFMPIIRLAGAIITDEGGVTCHAAIIARELGIPCIIGTKIATKVLKDGDVAEVDATNGVVRRIV